MSDLIKNTNDCEASDYEFRQKCFVCRQQQNKQNLVPTAAIVIF